MLETLLPGLSAAENLHPMVIHFPIAFWVASVGAWTLSVVLKNDEAWRFGLWLLGMASVTALVAIGFGFWATEQMGHDSPGHGLVHTHRDIMIATTVLSWILFGAAWFKRAERGGWRIGILVASVVLLTIGSLGADRGAELVFSYGMGVAKTPPKTDDGHSHSHGGDSGSDDHHANDPKAQPDHHAESGKTDQKDDDKAGEHDGEKAHAHDGTEGDDHHADDGKTKEKETDKKDDHNADGHKH